MREVTIELFHIRLDSDCGTRSILQTEWPCRGGLMWKCAASILLLRGRSRSRSCRRRRLRRVCVSECACFFMLILFFCFSLILAPTLFLPFDVCALFRSAVCGWAFVACMCVLANAFICVRVCASNTHTDVHMLPWMDIGALSFSWGKIDKYIWMSLSSLL